MNTTRLAVIPLCMLLLTGCAVGKSPRVRFEISEWAESGFHGRHITTDHFNIYSTLRDQEFEESLPAYLETVYDQYTQTIPPPDGMRKPILMYVFGLRSEWEDFTRRRFPRRAPVYLRISRGGFTENGVSALFHPNRGGKLAILAHEGWHQYVASRFSEPIPAWLDEGLACYHESFDCAGPKPRFTPTRNTLRLDTLREAFQRNELLSLETIVATDAGRVLSERGSLHAQVYYAQAWSLVAYLRHHASEERRQAFEEMLEDIADGSFGRKCSAARLLSGASTNAGLGELAFRAYFDAAPADFEGVYRDRLRVLLGYERAAAQSSGDGPVRLVRSHDGPRPPIGIVSLVTSK